MVRNQQAQAYEAKKTQMPVTQVELADESDVESDQDFIEVQQTADSSQLQGKLTESKADVLEKAKREKKKALASFGNFPSTSNSSKSAPIPVASTSKAKQTEWTTDDHKSHAIGLMKMAQKRKMKPSKNPAFDFEFDGEAEDSDGEGPSHVIKIGTNFNSGMEVLLIL